MHWEARVKSISMEMESRPIVSAPERIFLPLLGTSARGHKATWEPCMQPATALRGTYPSPIAGSLVRSAKAPLAGKLLPRT